MPVTLEPIGAFGLTSDFWNLPTDTAEGKPIDYFTFSGWWHAKRTWDVRALTHWELVALHPVSGVPATEQVLRLVHVEEDDLPEESGSREQVPPAFPEDFSTYLRFSPDHLEALIAWLRSRGVPTDSSFDGGRIFEPVDIEGLMRLGLLRRSLLATSIGGQPYRYYLYHGPGLSGQDAAFTVASLCGWTSQSRFSAGKSLQFDTYTSERLVQILEVQARYAGRTEPVPWEAFSFFMGRGAGPFHVTHVELSALRVLLERHQFPEFGP